MDVQASNSVCNLLNKAFFFIMHCGKGLMRHSNKNIQSLILSAEAGQHKRQTSWMSKGNNTSWDGKMN